MLARMLPIRCYTAYRRLHFVFAGRWLREQSDNLSPSTRRLINLKCKSSQRL